MEKIIEKNMMLIIPCYNEEFRLQKQSFISFVQEFPNIHVCFVNDGSTDKTQEIIEELSQKASSISYLTLDKNVGKAEAVRAGILKHYSNYKFIGYFDADLSTPLHFSENLKNTLLNNPDSIMAFGSRQLASTGQISRRKRRHAAGRMVSFLINKTLDIHFEDTQCGAKLFKQEIVSSIFEKPFVSSWIFDVELIHRIRKNLKNDLQNQVIEIPVTSWHDVGESKVSPWYFFKLLVELNSIRQS